MWNDFLEFSVHNDCNLALLKLLEVMTFELRRHNLKKVIYDFSLRKSHFSSGKCHQSPSVTSLTTRFCPNQLFTESKQSQNHISLCEPLFLLHLNVTLPFHSAPTSSCVFRLNFSEHKGGFTGDEKPPDENFSVFTFCGEREAEFFHTFHNQRDRRFALFTRTTSGQTEYVFGTAPRVM